MPNTELCVYESGKTGIQTLLDDTGHCIYSGKPASDYAQRGFKIMPFTDALVLIEEALKDRYSKPWQEISEEDYWDMLEILPPESYHPSGCFRMSEYLEGNYTAHYIANANRYWTATRAARPTWDFYLHELALQLSN